MMEPWEMRYYNYNPEKKEYEISSENKYSIGKFLVEKIKKETIKSNEDICLFQEARNLVAKQKNNQKSILFSVLLNSRNDKQIIDKEEQNIDEEAKELIRRNVLNTEGLPKTEIRILDVSYSGISNIQQLDDTHINQLIIENCDQICLLHTPRYTKIVVLEECKRLEKINQLPVNLEHLIIKSCNKLEKICDIETAKKLKIVNCKNLKKLPNLPDSLEELTIEGCDGLLEISNLPRKLKKIKIVNCKSLNTLKLPKECALSLENKGLELKENKNLKSIEGIDQIPQIKIKNIDIKLPKNTDINNINTNNFKNEKKNMINIINDNDNHIDTKSVGWFLTEICKEDIKNLTELRIFEKMKKVILNFNECEAADKYKQKTGNDLNEDVRFFSKECIKNLKGLQQSKKINKLDISKSGIETVTDKDLTKDLDYVVANECDMKEFKPYQYCIKKLCIQNNNNLEIVKIRAKNVNITTNRKLKTIKLLPYENSCDINNSKITIQDCAKHDQIKIKLPLFYEKIILSKINIKSIGTLNEDNVQLQDVLKKNIIKEFIIKDCTNLETINLPNNTINIKKLVIENCRNDLKQLNLNLNCEIEEIEIIDNKNIYEEQKCNLVLPKNLKNLTIKSNKHFILDELPNSLEELTLDVPIKQFQFQGNNLKKLSIESADFDKIKRLPSKYLEDKSKKKIFHDSLEEITIKNCKNLSLGLCELPKNLKALIIEDCEMKTTYFNNHNYDSLDFPDNIEKIVIKNCAYPQNNLCKPNFQLPNNIKELELEKCCLECYSEDCLKLEKIFLKECDIDGTMIIEDGVKELTMEKITISDDFDEIFPIKGKLDELKINNCCIHKISLPEKIKKVFIENSEIETLNGLKNRKDIVLIKDDEEFANLKDKIKNINIVLLNTFIGECDNEELMKQIKDKKMVFEDEIEHEPISINPKENLKTINDKGKSKND